MTLYSQLKTQAGAFFQKLRSVDASKVRDLLMKRPAVSSGGDTVSGPVKLASCDYGASKILVLEALKDRDGLTIEKLRVEPRPEAGASAVEQLKKIFDGADSRRVRTSVKSQSVLTRFIQFPKMTFEELKSALSYEAENFIPFKLDEVILDFYILRDKAEGEDSNMMDVLLVAAKKEEVYGVVKDFQDAELQLEFIDIDVLAAVNALEHFYPEDCQGAVAFLDLGKELSGLCILREGKPCFIRDISFGGMDVAKRLRRKLGLTWPQASEVLEGKRTVTEDVKEALKEGYEALCAEIKVSLDYYLGQVSGGKPPEKLFLAGGRKDDGFFASILSEYLQLPVVNFSVTDKVKLGPGVDRRLFEESQGVLPVALGLCLRS